MRTIDELKGEASVSCQLVVGFWCRHHRSSVRHPIHMTVAYSPEPAGIQTRACQFGSGNRYFLSFFVPSSHRRHFLLLLQRKINCFPCFTSSLLIHQFWYSQLQLLHTADSRPRSSRILFYPKKVIFVPRQGFIVIWQRSDRQRQYKYGKHTTKWRKIFQVSICKQHRDSAHDDGRRGMMSTQDEFPNQIHTIRFISVELPAPWCNILCITFLVPLTNFCFVHSCFFYTFNSQRHPKTCLLQKDSGFGNWSQNARGDHD
jgi:hypothetical protein